MTIEYQGYEERYAQQVESLFDAFQGYLAHSDPLKRIKFEKGYGKLALEHTLKQISENMGSMYLALNGETVVGFIAGIIEQLDEFDKKGVVPTKPGKVLELYIDASYRGQGIGTTLMQKLETYFLDKGCDVMKTVVFAPNTLAYNLYKKQGFEDREIELIKQLI